MPRPVSLSPELLQTLLSVVSHQGDAATAASALGINQPSMSKRLALLQHSGRVLRRPWLMREGKTWHLTEEGRKVLPAVEDLVRRYEQLRRFATRTSPAGVSVGCGQEAVAGVMLTAARVFRNSHADVPFRISTCRGQSRIENVASGAFDLALVTHEPAAILEIAHRDLHIEELYADPLVLAASPNHPALEAFTKLPDARVSAKALSTLPLVLPEPDSGMRKAFDARMREAGYATNPVIECGGWSAQLEYVKEGFGVGLLPQSIAARDPSLLVKRPQPSVAPGNVIRLICRRKHAPETGLDLTKAATAFREALLEAVREKYPAQE